MKDISGRSPRILVIRSGAIGDTLMVTPLLRAIRASFPGSYVGVVTSAPAADVLAFNPNVDEVFPIKYRHLPVWANAEKRRLIRRLKKADLNFVISLESHRDFTELARRIGADRLITFDERAEFDNAEIISPQPDEHSAAVNLRAGEAIGTKSDGRRLECFYPARLDNRISEKLAEHGIFENDLVIGIHAGWGARQHDPEDTRLRSWPASRFAEVAKWLAQHFNAKIVFTGSQNDVALNDLIGRQAGISYTNAAGKYTILETAALIRRMDLLLSVDSGPAHIAAAVGTPLVTLWGPGIYSATSPIQGDGRVRILLSPPPCAPCYGTTLMRSCTDNICMKQIDVDDVKGAISELLGDKDLNNRSNGSASQSLN
jgi:ADP-heptose:LPS heptosyltransferase